MLQLPDPIARELVPMAARHMQAVDDLPDPVEGKALASESVVLFPYIAEEGNSHRMFVAPEAFETWYAGSTDEELELAKQRAFQRVAELMPLATSRRYDEGLYDQAIRHGPPDANATHPPTHGLVTSSRTEPMGDDMYLVKTTLVPWEGHADLYDVRDEFSWLALELRRRRRLAEDQ
ncbi:MAG: hypothetical protein DRQ55_19500 [Planctomycetota bacterium]|nr:MAG: hypothetical protein DRQ55_19500 [Planctomycetota bacterium]